MSDVLSRLEGRTWTDMEKGEMPPALKEAIADKKDETRKMTRKKYMKEDEKKTKTRLYEKVRISLTLFL